MVAAARLEHPGRARRPRGKCRPGRAGPADGADRRAACREWARTPRRRGALTPLDLRRGCADPSPRVAGDRWVRPLESLARLVFQQFPDARVEARYRHDQRSRQAKFTRAMAIIAAGMFATYSLFNPLFIGWEDTALIALGHWSLVPVLAIYAWYVGRPGYPTNRFADIAMLAAAQPGMYFAAKVFAATGASDWRFGPLLCYNVMVAL